MQLAITEVREINIPQEYFWEERSKGWNLNLTFLNKFWTTVLLWQCLPLSSSHLQGREGVGVGTENRKSQVLDAQNAHLAWQLSNSINQCPQDFNRYLRTISLCHSCSHSSLNHVWQAQKRRFIQRWGSRGRTVPTCVRRRTQTACSWRWKSYTGEEGNL